MSCDSYSESDVESIINEENNQLDSIETASEVLENVEAIEEPESGEFPIPG